MPKPARGEIRWTSEGRVARITIQGKERRSFLLLSCRTDAEAEERAKLLAELAQRFRRAGVITTPDARKLLETAASCAPALLAGVMTVAGALVGGDLVPVDSVPTFAALAKDWTDGTLAKDFPDHVRAKDSELDAQRLKKLNAIDVGGVKLGDIPLDRFTLDHAQEAMKHLPEEAKRPATRRQYALLVNRVLGLAVYPCRHIKANPLPKGFLPKVGKAPAYPYLYPSEDGALLGCAKVPLARRVLYAFLAREGCRYSEAVSLTFDEFDLTLGTVTLDKNKTDDPRSWALDTRVTIGLRAWKKRRGADRQDRVFVDEHGRPLSEESMAETFRADLGRAGITRRELFHAGTNRQPIRVHDLRSTFVTLALAAGKSETWVADRTGHKSSQMINRYRRQARLATELGLGLLAPMDEAIPELFALGSPRDLRAPQDSNLRPPDSKSAPAEPDSGPSSNRAAAADEARGCEASAGDSGAVPDPVEAALADALTRAALAGAFDVVAQLAAELRARREARAGVVSLEAERAKRDKR